MKIYPAPLALIISLTALLYSTQTISDDSEKGDNQEVEELTVPVTVSLNYMSLPGKPHTVKIVVDGKSVGTMRFGQTKTFQIKQGVRVFRMVNTPAGHIWKSNKVKVNVFYKQPVKLHGGFSLSNFLLKGALFWPALYATNNYWLLTEKSR